MTEDQRELYQMLMRSEISNQEFLRRFPTVLSGPALCLQILQNAVNEREDDDLSIATGLTLDFGFMQETIDLLRAVYDTDWHYAHEDIVFSLSKANDPSLVDFFYRVTQVTPQYLEWDENRALAVKAIWGLGNIGNAEAVEKLKVIARSNEEVLQRNAVEQLERLSEI